jgi:ribosomal protein S27E
MKKRIKIGIPFKGFKNVPRELRGKNSNKNRWTRILEGFADARCPDCSDILLLTTVTYTCPSYTDMRINWEDPKMELSCKRCGYRVIGTGDLFLDNGIYSIASFTIVEQKRKESGYVKKGFGLKRGK